MRNEGDIIIRNNIIFKVIKNNRPDSLYRKILYRLNGEDKQEGYTSKEKTDVLIGKEYKGVFNSE